MLSSVLGSALLTLAIGLNAQDPSPTGTERTSVVVAIQHAVAGELEQALKQLASRIADAPLIAHDPRTNSLLLSGTNRSIAQLAVLIKELDKPSGSRSSAPGDAATAAQASKSLFPPANHALQLSAATDDSERTSLKLLLERYAEATAQQVIYDAGVSARLASIFIDTPRDFEVPATAVQGFLERVVGAHDVILIPLGGKEPHVVSVVIGSSNGSRSSRERAYFLPEAEQPLLAQHPAVLFTTLISVRNADANQIAQSVRQAMTDNQLQFAAPVGNSILLTGSGAWLNGMVQLLKLADEQAPAAAVVPTVRHELVALTHTRVEEIAPLLRDAFQTAHRLRAVAMTPQAQGMPGAAHAVPSGMASVQADIAHNALFITCDSRDWDAIRALISALDRK